METTLTVVVAAIVILITALVVITIFGSGITQVSGIMQARSICQTQCEASCRATGTPPITWNVPTIRDENNNVMSCQGIGLSCTQDECNTIRGTSGGGGASGGGTAYTCKGNTQCYPSSCPTGKQPEPELTCSPGQVCCQK